MDATAGKRPLLWILVGVAVLLAAVLICRALLLDDPSLEGLSAGAARIERMRRSGDVSGLAEALEAPDPAIAALAARALGDLAPKSLPHLEQALKAPRPPVREAAAVALARAGAAGKGPLLAAVAADDDSAPVRAAAVTALGRLRAVDEMPALLKALRDPSPAVRGRAAEAVTAITGIKFNFRADAPPEQRWRMEEQIRRLWKQFEPTIRKRLAGH